MSQQEIICKKGATREKEARVKASSAIPSSFTTKTAYQPAWLWIEIDIAFLCDDFLHRLSVYVQSCKVEQTAATVSCVCVWAIYICTCDAPTECSRFEFCSCWVARPGVLLHSQRAGQTTSAGITFFVRTKRHCALSVRIKRACRQQHYLFHISDVLLFADWCDGTRTLFGNLVSTAAMWSE